MRKLISITRQQQGFTLVEIIAVVFIIGVMIGLVAIRVGGVSERELAMEAQKLYQKIRLLAEEAEFSGTEMGLSLTDDGYELFQFDESSLKWIPSKDENLKPAFLESRYTLTMSLQDKVFDTAVLYKKEKREKARDYGEKKHEEPEIMFFSDGQITPFELTLVDKNISKKRYVVSGTGFGKLSIQEYAH